MAESNAILNFQGKDDGFSKILNSASDGFDRLAETVTSSKDNLTGLRDESGLFEKAFKGLTGTVKRGQNAFDTLEDSASAIGTSFTTSAKITDVTNQSFVKMAASSLGLGKQVGFLNTALGPLGDLWHEVDDAQTGVGKGFAVLNTLSKPLIGMLKTGAALTAELAESLKGTGEAGDIASAALTGVSKTLNKLVTGVKIADFAGDIYRVIESAKTFVEEQLPDLIEQAKGAAEMFDKLGIKTMLFGDKLKTVRTIATALSAVGKGAVKELSQMTIKLLDFREQAKMFVGIATAIRDAHLRLKGLNEGFSTFQAMGIDTTMAELAVQIGVVGEGLFTSAEAAKNFAKVTITAFAQVEDKLAYLRTLSTAAKESVGTLFNSMQALASGPLKNAATAADVAKVSYYSMSAGADTLAKSNQLSAAAIKTGVAGQIDFAQATNTIANALAPYQKNLRDADKIAGQLFATLEYGQLDMGNLAGAIGELASAGATINIPIEQIQGMYAKLTQVGPPAEAATRLSNLLESLQSVSGPAQEELDKLGIRLDKFAIQQKGALPILEEVYKKTGGNIEILRKIFPNDYAFQAFMGFVRDIEGTQKVIEKIGAAGAPTLEEMFNKRRESLMQKATELMNGFRAEMEKFGQRMLPMLEPVIDFLGDMLERFQQMPEPMKQFIAASALTTIGLSKVTEVGGTFGGMLLNLGKMYLMARVSSLLWSGQLLNEGKILRDMVVNQKDYAGAIMRLFGIQQQSANAFTTVAAAQMEAAKAAALGKQADDARIKASTAQVAASKLAENAEKLKAVAVTLSAEADQASAVATRLKAEADAAGGMNATLNAQADEAAAAAARSRTLANEAGAKASQAQAAADVKLVEATKANQVAKDVAHNADLANKNASIRASQAAAAAEVESNKLAQAAVVVRTKASQATQTALALESVSAEKAAAATAAKSAADQAGGNNAILNARAVAAQTTAQSAQVAASKAATTAIELNNVATIAETKSTEAAALAQSTHAEAELASAFATKKNTEAKVENATVSLADDTAVDTIDLATGAVTANTTQVSANTQAKAVNTATSLADDDAWQTLEVVNGVVQTNTVQVAANTGAKATHATTTGVDTAAEVVSSSATGVNTEEKAKNTTATVVNTQARGLLGKINAFLTGEINLQNIAMFKNTMAMKATAGAAQSTLKFTDIFTSGIKAATENLGNFGAQFKNLTQNTSKFSFADLFTGAKTNIATASKGITDTLTNIPNLIQGGYTNSLNAGKKATEVFTNSLKGVGGGAKGFLGFLNSAPGMMINGLAPALGAASVGTNILAASATTLWTVLAPILPIVIAISAAIAGFMIFKEIGQMLGLVGSDFSKMGESVDETTKELTKMRSELGKTKEEVAEKPPEEGWFGSVLKYIGLTRDKTAEYTGFLNTVLFPTLNLAANLITLPFRFAGDAIKWVLDLFSGGKASKVIDNFGAKVGDAGKKFANFITFGKLEDQINSLDGSVNGFFKMVKDGAQEMMERPMTEAFQKQDALIQELLLDAKKMEWQVAKGKIVGKEAQDLLEKARADADKRGVAMLEGKQFDDVIKKNRETVQAQTKINDEAVQKLTKQLEDPKLKKARKDQLQVQIDALKAESSALDENLKKQEKYLQNIQSLAQRIDENNAAISSDAVIKNLRQQQYELLKDTSRIPAALREQYVSTFESLEEGMNNTSAMQRRMNSQLITAVKDFADNAKVAKDINSPEDLQKMQQEADTFRDRILQSFESGAIGPEVAQKLIGEIADQEITVDAPNFKFKGKILSVEQQQALIEAQTKINQGMVDRRVAQIQQSIEDIGLAESKGELLQGQAQSKRLEQQIKIDTERLDNAKKTEELMLKGYGEKSPQYIKAQQDRQAAERSLDKTNYDKRQAQDDYYTERRVKAQERAIARIKSATDQQRLTEGQGAIETLKREDQINAEQVARLRKRMLGMKDTTSDAYKDLQSQVEQLENDGATKRFQIQGQKEDYALDRRVKTHESAIAQISLAEQTLLKTQGQAQQATLQQELVINAERAKLARARLERIGRDAGVGSDVYKDQLREVQALERDATIKRFQLQRQQEDYALDRRVKVHEEAIAKINAAEQVLLKTQGQAQQETLQQEIAINAERLKLARSRLADIGKRAGTGSDAYKDQLREVNSLERDSMVKRFQLQRQQEDYALERRVKVHEDAIAQINVAEQILLKTQGQAQQETLQREIEINAERVKLARSRLAEVGRRAGTGSDVYKDQLREVENLERESTVKRFQLQRQQEDYALERRVKVHEDAIARINASEQTLLKTQGQAQQETLQQEIAINTERVKLARARLEETGRRAGIGSDVYKDQLREVENLERESTVKRFQLQRQQEDYTLERRVKGHEDAIARINAAEQTLFKTQGQAQQEILQQELAINAERAKQARARLEEAGRRAGTGSDVYKDQLREVENLERESTVKRFQLQRQMEDYALDRRVKIHEEAISRINAAEQTLLKTQGQAQQEILEREIAINAERTKQARSRLEEAGRRAGTGSDVYKDQLREVENLERESTVKRFQLQRQQEDYALERRVKIHEDAIADIALSEKLLQRTQYEAGQETLRQEIEINAKRIELAQSRLEQTRIRAGENSDIFQDQERELRALERSQIEKTFQLRSQEIVNNLEVQQQRITNEVEAQNQAYKAQLDRMDLISAQMQHQQELAESRNSLLQTATEGIQQQVENISKLTSDERLNAQLQVTTARTRLEALERSQAFERDNLKRQEATRKMALDRQKIELQTNKLANQRAILEENINFSRLQATQKVTAEQQEQHRLLLSNLQQQDSQYVAQEENLNEQIASLSEINQNARDELDIRQQQAKDGGVMDVLLAKQSQMTAQLEKEREILEKRNELAKARTDAYAGQLGILSQTTNSERKQRDVAAAIAAIKLNSLAQQQQGEAQVLELQIKQRAAVLEQEKSRLRMMDAENKSRMAEAKERVISAIAEGKSAEQIQARIDALKGYTEASAGIRAAGISLDERSKYEAQMAQHERSGLVAKQVQDRQQAQLELAQNLPTGLQRQMKNYVQGEVFNQLGVGWGDVQQMGRNTAYSTMSQGYDTRSAFPALAPLEAPKAVNYEAIRRDALAELNELIAPTRETLVQLQKQTVDQQKSQFEALRNTVVQESKQLNVTPVVAPKPVDYEAIRKDALAQLNEFVVPKRTAPQPQQQIANQHKVQIDALQKTVDAIAKRQPTQLDQKNTFNINLPAGSTSEQAKSLEQPLIQLQMDIWKGVRKELGL
jgi:hypothetical protein